MRGSSKAEGQAWGDLGEIWGGGTWWLRPSFQGKQLSIYRFLLLSP